jgi:hypothetical protein
MIKLDSAILFEQLQYQLTQQQNWTQSWNRDFFEEPDQKHTNYFSELELEVLHKNKEPPNTGPDCGPLGRTHQNKRSILMH